MGTGRSAERLHALRQIMYMLESEIRYSCAFLGEAFLRISEPDETTLQSLAAADEIFLHTKAWGLSSGRSRFEILYWP